MNAVMPKGVEHIADAAVRASPTVTTAVMPKGVEHMAHSQTLLGERDVMNAVMPKGVEHSDRRLVMPGITVARVRNAVMPKGVEHTANPRRR